MSKPIKIKRPADVVEKPTNVAGLERQIRRRVGSGPRDDSERSMTDTTPTPVRAHEMAIKSIRRATTREEAERVLDYIVGAAEHRSRQEQST